MKNEVRFRKKYDVSYRGTRYKNNYGKSQTVPDMNLSVRQLMTNHTRGVLDVQSKEEMFYGDLEIPVIKDLSELTDLKEQNEEQKRKIEDEINIARDKKQKAKLAEEAKEKAELDEFRKAKKATESKPTEPLPPVSE